MTDGGDHQAADRDQLARACADALWADDQASRGLGMNLVEVAPGRAVVAMTVTAAMVNGHGMMHGGFIFTLADSAFAFACNTHNQRAVAAGCQITYIQPARLGDRLTATAVERSRTGRTGITDVTVVRGDDAVIAEFRGNSRTIEGTLV
jgi:acyl-CoA thioesterase